MSSNRKHIFFGEIVIPARNDAIVLEYSMIGWWEPPIGEDPQHQIPGHWELDQPTPLAVRRINRHGQEVVRDVVQWYDKAARRETAVYAALCRWIDSKADFHSLVHYALQGQCRPC